MTDDQSIPFAPQVHGASGRPGSNPPSRPCAGSPTHYPNGRWSEQAKDELKRLYDLTGDDKLSMQQIADRMKTVDHRITRNAVVGQVHRLGLPKRGAAPSWRPGKYPAERKLRVPVPPRKWHPYQPPPPAAPIVFEQHPPELAGRIGTYMLSELTERMCHGFPRKVLDVRYFGPPLYCGAPCLPIEITGAGPYCESCMRRFYQVRPVVSRFAGRSTCTYQP